MAYIQKNNPVPKTGCGRRRLEEVESLFKKKDACYNKAVRVYGTKNSAYRSGYMVRCRQGKLKN